MPRKAPADPEYTVSTETDESLVAAAERVFGEDLSDIPPIGVDFAEPRGRVPGMDKMVTVRGGGLYLPARQRVMWMRSQHPDWTIDTQAEKVTEGKYVGRDKVEGGYARYRSNVHDETGRLIATGTKTEFSERFTDFVEKAETGAIGRALAVAGYGTEAAVDLDEGYGEDRIADAPVTPSRPINITASAIPGIRAGGRPEHVTDTQIRDIGQLNKKLGLGYGIVTILEAARGEGAAKLPPLEAGKESKQIEEYLRTFTNDEAGEVVQRLTKAVRDQAEGAE